jgi:hypothetical protein
LQIVTCCNACCQQALWIDGADGAKTAGAGVALSAGELTPSVEEAAG